MPSHQLQLFCFSAVHLLTSSSSHKVHLSQTLPELLPALIHLFFYCPNPDFMNGTFQPPLAPPKIASDFTALLSLRVFLFNEKGLGNWLCLRI